MSEELEREAFEKWIGYAPSQEPDGGYEDEFAQYAWHAWRARASLSQASTEPRGCPTPGACSCIDPLPQAGEPVAVKPLEWRDGPSYSAMLVADCIFGEYWVWGGNAPDNACWSRGSLPGKLIDGGVDAAKAAAQADYEQRVRSCLVSAPPTAPADDTPKCFACAQPFKLGEMVIEDINEGTVHAACCGPDRDAYVHLDDGSPLADGESIPTGEPWFPDTPETRLAFKLGKEPAAAPAAEVDAVKVVRTILEELQGEEDDMERPANTDRKAGWHAALSAFEEVLNERFPGITDTSQKEG